MRFAFCLFSMALMLAGCARDDGHGNCGADITARVVSDQIKEVLGQDHWLLGKLDFALSNVRTTRLDEKVALASCHADLRISPPRDVVDFLSGPAGEGWYKANHIEYQPESAQLVTPVTFDAQRTDDKKSMVIANLAGFEHAIEGVRLLALRQPLVVDDGAFLQSTEVEKLAKLLSSFRLKTGVPIYLITIRNLPDSSPDAIALFAKQRAKDWHLQDGVLVVMSRDDRKIRLETLGVLDQRLPAERAKYLIDEIFTPHFKTADFAGGLELGLKAVMADLER